jgi:hypothetical protein
LRCLPGKTGQEEDLMRTFGAFLLAATLGAGIGVHGVAQAKGKKKGDEAAPRASSSEVGKLKAVRFGDPKAGFFKWGMHPDEVQKLASVQVEAKYKTRIDQNKQDPGKQTRIREEMFKELAAMKKSYTKFEGDKSGWDVSIIGAEFDQKTGEAVLVVKEDIWTRYFFFFEDGLYKMFLAFNKEALEGKGFADFGKDREASYGRAKEVYRDEKIKGGVKHHLDHFEWTAGGDRLRLVDRSEFYGVYCLILEDAGVAKRVMERRKIVNPGGVKTDSLVDAVTAKDKNERDANDNIIDRLTGKEVKRPGDEEKHADIVVPSPTKSPSPSDVNSSSKNTASSSSPPPEKEPAGKKKGKRDPALDGLEL